MSNQIWLHLWYSGLIVLAVISIKSGLIGIRKSISLGMNNIVQAVANNNDNVSELSKNLDKIEKALYYVISKLDEIVRKIK